MNYSVIDRPVVKALTKDDKVVELNFREVFSQAHLLQDISGDNALDRYAMFRLLLAFTMDMLQLKTYRDRKGLLRQGCFDMAVFDGYVSTCERSGACFDLLDKAHPFMQAALDEEMDANAVRSSAKLSPLLPSGNNHMFWDHRMEDMQEMCLPQAFRAMIGLYLFCTAQGQGFPSPVNNTTPVYTMVKGKNLFETMVLNMVSIEECSPIPYGTSSVPWRRFDKIIPKEETADISFLEALTWQPRRITLECDDDLTVRQIRLQQGKNFRGNGLWVDPHVPRFCNKKGEWMTLKPQSQRALWRDVGTLLLDASGSRFRAPLTVTQSIEVRENDSEFLDIYEIGVVTNQASYVEVMEDELALPGFLFTDRIRASLFIEETQLIENIQYSIGHSISQIMKDSVDVQEEARTLFLSTMHDELLGPILSCLMDTDADSEESLGNYLKVSEQRLMNAVRLVIRNVIEKTGTGVQQMQAQTEIQGRIMAFSKKILKERKETYGL